MSDFKENTYCLIYQEQAWSLLYINNDKEHTDILIDEIEGLREIISDKNLSQIATDNLKKKIKKILNQYHTTYVKEPVTYSHQVLQGGIMHPEQAMVIPFMPEEISNSDGEDKQDCEMNAAKRLVTNVCKETSSHSLIFCGDSLFSKQPLIEHAGKDRIRTNLFRYEMSCKGKITYQNLWVTDLEITKDNIKDLVRGGRCRWKSENECFNVLKNQGYCLEHSYGHGKDNLCFNFYLMTLIVFFMHQIFELTESTYQAARKKFGSKRHMWETLRAYIKIIIFDSWKALLDFALTPPRYTLTQAHSP